MRKAFELVNMEGCIMDSIKTTSYKKAREYFKKKFGGEFYIYQGENRKKVKL